MSRERIFNLPGVITGLIAGLALIQLAVEVSPQSLGVWTITYFSFIPARVSFFIAPQAALAALADVDGDELAALLNTARYAWWTPLTYAFLHANWTHLGINSLTLAAFGTRSRAGSAPRAFCCFSRRRPSPAPWRISPRIRSTWSRWLAPRPRYPAPWRRSPASPSRAVAPWANRRADAWTTRTI